ncbi:hypothetical protein [Priestia megaterium]|uniref:hypothetical protein n=1 Tax=Priestia megaterium TaxID=1404 RepID=UPI0023DA16FC|nr:hypothetical protein [Priestia megaterium]MDF2013273.1 hypothetical protein [Priestia megaterium]
MSKGISKKEIREFYKNKAGINVTEDLKKSCAKCAFFNITTKYCGEHKIKVKTNESCNGFKTQRAHKIYSGGSVSPK